jgi:hypothetical protein
LKAGFQRKRGLATFRVGCVEIKIPIRKIMDELNISTSWYMMSCEHVLSHATLHPPCSLSWYIPYASGQI